MENCVHTRVPLDSSCGEVLDAKVLSLVLLGVLTYSLFGTGTSAYRDHHCLITLSLFYSLCILLKRKNIQEQKKTNKKTKMIATTLESGN